jgi:tRNA-2-methylthio-N6-dimethylallyladenosine synthase
VDDVTAEEKMRRNQVLLEDQDRRGILINEGMVGKVVEVMAEGPSLRNAERWAGRAGSNKIVIFEPRREVCVGDIVRILVDKAAPQTLYGTMVGDSM